MIFISIQLSEMHRMGRVNRWFFRSLFDIFEKGVSFVQMVQLHGEGSFLNFYMVYMVQYGSTCQINITLN